MIDDTGDFYEGYTITNGPLAAGDFVELENGDRNVPAFRPPSFQIAQADCSVQAGGESPSGIDCGGIPDFYPIPDDFQWSTSQSDTVEGGILNVPVPPPGFFDSHGFGRLTVGADKKWHTDSGFGIVSKIVAVNAQPSISDIPDIIGSINGIKGKLRIIGPTFGVITTHKANIVNTFNPFNELSAPLLVTEISLPSSGSKFEIVAPDGDPSFPWNGGVNWGVAIFWIGIKASELPAFPLVGDFLGDAFFMESFF